MRVINNEKRPLVVAYTNAGALATGLTVSIAMYKVSDQSDITPSPSTLTEIGSGLYFLPANKVPDVTSDDIAWVMIGPDTLTDPDRYKFGALAFGGYPNTLITGQVSIASAVDGLGGGQFTGNGITPVDEDYGGADNMKIVDNVGAPLDNAIIYIYLKSDYLAGNTDNTYVKGFSISTVTGTWEWPSNLDPATYYVIVQLVGYEQVEPKEVVVT